MSGTPYSLRFEVYQEARSNLMDRFYSDHEVWTNWTFASEGDRSTMGNCPVEKRPSVPSNNEILEEAEKIYNLGFDNIILATGYESTSIDKPDYIKEIVGKDVPF